MEGFKLFITVVLLVLIVAYVIPALISAVPTILMIVGAFAIVRKLARLSASDDKESETDPAK